MSSDYPSLSQFTAQRFRIMEVKLRFSEWKTTNKNGKFYMKLWIQPGRKLQTKLVKIKRGKKLEWEERFVFWVSENFVDGDSTIYVEIYEKHKLRRDSQVGSGKYDLKLLFGEKEEEKDPVYDDYDGDEIKSVEKQEEEKGGKEAKSRGGIEVGKRGSWKASVVFEAVIWKGYIEKVGSDHGIKWSGFAMEYDAFMCSRSIHESTNSACLCFAYQTAVHD